MLLSRVLPSPGWRAKECVTVDTQAPCKCISFHLTDTAPADRSLLGMPGNHRSCAVIGPTPVQSETMAGVCQKNEPGPSQQSVQARSRPQMTTIVPRWGHSISGRALRPSASLPACLSKIRAIGTKPAPIVPTARPDSCTFNVTAASGCSRCCCTGCRRQQVLQEEGTPRPS